VDAISSSHFFEHVPDVGTLVEACARVLKPGGLLEVVVPHFSNPYYYSDPTHRTPFGLYSFSYFAVDDVLRRKVPRYGRQPLLRLLDVRLGFKSARPFALRHAAKRAIGLLVNRSTFTKELYEENFSHVVPCYEVTFRLERLP
jgi:SAM-dependent methyltransferase